MRRLCVSLALAVAVTLLVAVPVLAGIYKSYLVVESTGADYEHLALNLSLDVNYLATHGYIDPTGLDTRVTDASGYVLPHMLADDKVLWVADVPANKTSEFLFWTGQNLTDSLPIIAGHGGYVTVPDDPDIELGDMYGIVVVGYVDTTAGANKSIVRKTGAALLSVTDDEEITFDITGGSSLVGSGVVSGEMSIIIISDSVDVWMTIDTNLSDNITGVEVDRQAASVVTNTSSNWILFENDVMPYVYDFEIYKA